MVARIPDHNNDAAVRELLVTDGGRTNHDELLDRVLRAAQRGYDRAFDTVDGETSADWLRAPDEEYPFLTYDQARGHHNGDSLKDHVIIELNEGACDGETIEDFVERAVRQLDSSIDLLRAAQTEIRALMTKQG